MPTHTVTLNPGVNTEYTLSLNSANYSATNLIRFGPSGLCQKMGGWSKFYATPIASTVTALHAYEDLTSVSWLAVGSINQLAVISSGTLTDITPQTNTTNPSFNFSTVSGSTVVTIVDTNSQTTIYDVVVIETQVSIGGIILFGPYAITSVLSSDQYQITVPLAAISTINNSGMVPVFTATIAVSIVSVNLANHGYSVGSTFSIEVPVTVGGLTLSGFYTVSAVTDANNFIITAPTVATGNATATMNGGNAQFLYYIAPGPNTRGNGYGDGGYGLGGYGYGVIPPTFTGTPITATDYTLDNFGGYLVACPNNGPIFTWQSQSGLYTAQMIANAPVINTGMFVSMSAEIIVAYGSSVLGVQDPLLINWCSAGNFNNWTATTANSAGSFRLSKGSEIIGGLQGPQYALIWTDIDVWSMTFIGQPLVFGFTELSTGCGLAGKFAAGVLGTTVFWMSYKSPTVGSAGAGQFYALPSGGSVTPVPCTVWDVIFQNIDNANLSKIRCAVNSPFGEIMWFFPVADSMGENTMYVKFTPQFSAWDYGTLGRSAWIDQSVFGPPIGADAATNYIYQHETSNDADGQAMGEFMTTGYVALTDGQDKAFCDLVYPDMRFGFLDQSQTATVGLSFSFTDYPTGTTVYTSPTYTMSSSGPPYITPRFRARLTSMTLGNSTQGSFWRLGGLRIRTAVDGRL